MADPKFIGTDRPGFFGVLHTWGRAPEYHPHVHYVVPGGGLSGDGTRWLPARADFLVPVRALSIVFRAKFREALKTLMETRTTFIIAHRIQSVMIADLILVMDKGHIVQQGSHDTLIAQDGMYKQIFELQSRIEDELEQEIASVGL